MDGLQNKMFGGRHILLRQSYTGACLSSKGLVRVVLCGLGKVEVTPRLFPRVR
jgi:hypothetical protein